MARIPSNRGIGLALFAVVPVTAALSFAAVPFYSWFCKVTGFAAEARRSCSSASTAGPSG